VHCIRHSDSSHHGESANLGSACASPAGDDALVLADFSFPGKALHPDQFGLVAEQVEKVNPDLVARDEQGKAYTVRYER
jgi:hypothetical protein